MKIICVGWNYEQHTTEMQVERPAAPIIFMKPDSALLKENKPFFIPDFAQRFDYETELVFRICKLGKNIAPRFASRYYDAVALGVDFTARDLQETLRANGQPWELSKSFDGSAVISEFLPVGTFADANAIPFRLEINGKVVQHATSASMIFPIDEIVAYVSRYCTLKTGDLIFTGTPEGVGPVAINDELEGFIGEQKMFSFRVK